MERPNEWKDIVKADDNSMSNLFHINDKNITIKNIKILILKFCAISSQPRTIISGKWTRQLHLNIALFWQRDKLYLSIYLVYSYGL